jgi:hypothetical protein
MPARPFPFDDPQFTLPPWPIQLEHPAIPRCRRREHSTLNSGSHIRVRPECHLAFWPTARSSTKGEHP